MLAPDRFMAQEIQADDKCWQLNDHQRSENHAIRIYLTKFFAHVYNVFQATLITC